MTRRKLEKSILMHGGNVSLVTSVIVLVAFAAGLLVGTLVVAKVYGVNKGFSLVAPMTGSFADGWNAAKDKLASVNPMMSEASYLSGQVAAVNGKEISFTTELINPLDDESLKTRIAVIDDKTEITVWKLKSEEQAAKDREEAQAKLSVLQKESEALRANENACNQERMGTAAGPAITGEESADCKIVRAKVMANMEAMSEAQQKMDMYQKIDNANSGDIKAGWNISVTAQAIETGNEDNGPAMMRSQYENISSKQKFTVSSVDVRESQSPSAGMPGNPAPVTPIE